MVKMKPEEIKELLRQVPCPGRSRDIVALGFLKGVGVHDADVRVDFAPDIINMEKIKAMELGIRRVLEDAGFARVEIETEPPYDDDSLLLGGESTNPLQIELSQYGIEPALDRIEGEGARMKNLLAPEDSPEGAPTQSGTDEPPADELASLEPQGDSDPGYDGPLPVFQWQVRPDTTDPGTSGPGTRGLEVVKVKFSIDSWNFAIGWLVHPAEELVYASIQARHWIYYNGKARPNPAGKTEGVNLVYDPRRGGVVSIYGTVRDFRPFVEAFRRAYPGLAEGEDRPEPSIALAV